VADIPAKGVGFFSLGPKLSGFETLYLLNAQDGICH
jgi:hypothetical protein